MRPMRVSVSSMTSWRYCRPSRRETGCEVPTSSPQGRDFASCPGKLGGSPHVVHTRLESQALGALAESGLPSAKIYRLYPDIEHSAIDEALDLEQQLARNLRPVAA
jgi:uncharacterized protein (DUF433 family)